MLAMEEETETAKPTKAKRELPEEPDERDKVLRLARLPARMPVMAIDELARSMDMRPLSQQERDEGVDAWAALFWELGLFNSGKVLVALWTFGVVAPRFVDWVEDRKRKREGQAAKYAGAQVPRTPAPALQPKQPAQPVQPLQVVPPEQAGAAP